MNVRYGIELSRFLRELKEAEIEGKKIRSPKPRAMKLWLEAHRLNRRLPNEVMEIFAAAIEDRVASHEKRVHRQRDKRRANKRNDSRLTYKEKRNLYNYINSHIQHQEKTDPQGKASRKLAIHAYIESTSDLSADDFDSVASEYRRQYEEIRDNKDYIVSEPEDYETMFRLPGKKDAE